MPIGTILASFLVSTPLSVDALLCRFSAAVPLQVMRWLSKRDFTLSLGFALQRANSRMLRNADKRRRLARSSGKYSFGTRPTSSDEDY